jgi:hypothetical protein
MATSNNAGYLDFESSGFLAPMWKEFSVRYMGNGIHGDQIGGRSYGQRLTGITGVANTGRATGQSSFCAGKLTVWPPMDPIPEPTT